MNDSGDESDEIEFVGTQKVTIEIIDDTDDDDDDEVRLSAAKKAIPVDVISSSSSGSARKPIVASVARAPSSPWKQRGAHPLAKTSQEVINLCEDDSDTGTVAPTNRRKGPFATMHYQGRSQEKAIELPDSSISINSEEQHAGWLSDDSSVIFVDADKKMPAIERSYPASYMQSPDPDSSDDEMTMLRERMEQTRPRAPPAPPPTRDRNQAREQRRAELRRRDANRSRTAAINSPPARNNTSPARNNTSPARNNTSPARKASPFGFLKQPSPMRKAPPCSFLKTVPFMGKSSRAMKKPDALESLPAKKSPDNIMTNISDPIAVPRRVSAAESRKSARTVSEETAAEEGDDFPPMDRISDDQSAQELSESLPPAGTHSDEKMAAQSNDSRVGTSSDALLEIYIPRSVLTENHAQMERDDDSVAASDALTDGSVHDGTVCGEDYGDFASNDLGDFASNDLGQDCDDNVNVNDAGDDRGDRPLDCTFDDDTVVSVRESPLRQTRRPRQSYNGGQVDDSGDKENAEVVRRPMIPVATNRRLEAFADYDLGGCDYGTSDVHDEEEDSLPGDLFDKQDIYDHVSMNFVDRLSSLSEDPESGLPVRRFTVHGGLDDVLHDFLITVEQSEIAPGAGLGAFLKYLGARELKAERRDIGIDALEDYEPFVSETNGTLQARTPGGYGLSVSLTGENLHGNDNRLYWPKAMKKAYDAGEDFDRKELACQRALPEGIGFLGMHLESHYRAAPKTEFSSQGTCIPLGSYGPFQKEDRKRESQFTVKSFIFCNEPNEWPFDVEEKLFGEQQIIDITDDATGSPHELARKNIPMYVNEVGHNNKSKQNVFICHKDGRRVEYFIKVDSPLKKNDRIELLTNYGKVYEDIRERKGYGWRNTHRGLPSDEDRASELKRNFAEREDAENAIILLACPDLVGMIEFVKERIWLPVWTKAQAFQASLNDPASHGEAPPPSREQWIALRRIHWLRSVFLRRIRDLELTGATYGYPYKSSLSYCRDLLDSMEQNRFSVTVKSSESLYAIGEAIRQEIIEEMLYAMQAKLLMPFDRAVWCPLSVGLLQTLSDQVSVLLLSTKGNPSTEQKMALRGEILAAAEASANDFRKATKGGGVPNSLSFGSGIGIGKGSIISGSLKNLWGTVKCSNSFYLDNSTIPKGFLAGIGRMLAYYDSLILASVEPHQGDSFHLELTPSENFVMTQYNGMDESDQLGKLASMPRPIDSCAKTSIAVNETWYLVWQLIYVVHTFATEFLDGTDDTLKILCTKIGVDYKLAQFAVTRGMQLERNEGLRKRCCQKPRKRKAKRHLGSDPSARKGPSKKRRKALSKSDTNCGLKAGPNKKAKTSAKEIWFGTPGPDEIPGGWPEGWTKRTFERQSGESKGHTDSYWYTPILKMKLRSIKEIKRFMGYLHDSSGDEAQAWKICKGK